MCARTLSCVRVRARACARTEAEDDDVQFHELGDLGPKHGQRHVLQKVGRCLRLCFALVFCVCVYAVALCCSVLPLTHTQTHTRGWGREGG